ncbi:MAG: tRNA (guanosine(37)-N1)-methyltransferase TrmD [Fidelibacterota bacterium]
MTRIFIITPFPQMVEAVTGESILRRAQDKGRVTYEVMDLREYAGGKHGQLDDYPFGGGTGMVMMAEPILKAVDRAKEEMGKDDELRVVYPSPQGKLLTQDRARDLSGATGLIFICGHYKGIDERVCQSVVTDEISIGDYVLTGGELPAMVILDSIVRLIPGVLSDEESAASDSFSHDLLDHPHYTRPEEVRGMKVPDVLLTGHHARIQAWRKTQREMRTRNRRPDLWERYAKQQSE